MVWTMSLLDTVNMTSNNVPDTVRGHLIVVEGLDRSGKTTQCQMLCEDIRGTDREVKYVKFPGMPSLSCICLLQLKLLYQTGQRQQAR